MWHTTETTYWSKQQTGGQEDYDKTTCAHASDCDNNYVAETVAENNENNVGPCGISRTRCYKGQVTLVVSGRSGDAEEKT